MPDDLGDDSDDVDFNNLAERGEEVDSEKFLKDKLDLEGDVDLSSPILLDLLADDDRAAELKESVAKRKGKEKGADKTKFLFDNTLVDVNDDSLWTM